jgi:cysteine desulfurase / selenocysteine lyase
MGALADTALAQEFPSLDREGLVYLDSSATSQTPRVVLEAMDDYYESHRGTVHRSVYPLAAEATELFEGARERIARFLDWGARETILTRNATEALNLVAYSWGGANVGPGDRVVITEMEHHSNLVPWQLLCERTGATLDYVPVDDDGRLQLDVLDALLAGGDVRLVAVAHVSNVVGTINPVADIARRAHAAGAVVVVDGSQAVPQLPVNLRALDADFYAWTGHKAYGPTGIGVLHGRRELLDAMPPFISGGHMIASVSLDKGTRFAQTPAKFEAGTSAIAEGIGLGAAVDFLSGIGMDAVREHERDLAAYAIERLVAVPGVQIQGPLEADDRGALVSFTLEGVHPHDVAEILGARGVCIRAGHHCAQPLMKRFGVGATSRASFAVHNTREDVDRLVAGLDRVREVFAD